MKEILDSPHKTWNKQTIALMTGNVWDNGYFSNYIRSWNKLECNGIKNEPGHLQNFDLRPFGNIPLIIRNFFKFEVFENLVLMEIKTYYNRKTRWENDRQKVIHGYIVYGYDYVDGKSNVKIVKKFYVNNNYKSIKLIDWICDSLIEEE